MSASEDNEVQVSFVRLDLPAHAVERFRRILSEDEHERAGRLRFRRDADRFVTRRGMLRAALSERLGVAPAEVAFAYTPYGRPELAAPFDRSGLRFSVSHSDDLGMFAVCARRR